MVKEIIYLNSLTTKFAHQENHIFNYLVREYITVFLPEIEPFAITPFFSSTVKQSYNVVAYPLNIKIRYHKQVDAQLKSLEKHDLICHS